MPTFKNNTTHYIDYEALIQAASGETRKILVRFEPKEERGLPFWLPYQKLGLTLVNANYPAVPDKVLVSGTFKFNAGTERRFNIEPCSRYVVNILAQKGKVKFYAGASLTGQEVAEEADVPYRQRTMLTWETAPYIRLVCESGEAEVVLNVEKMIGELPSQRFGDEITWH